MSFAIKYRTAVDDGVDDDLAQWRARVKAKWKEMVPITPSQKGFQLMFMNSELMEIYRDAQNIRNTKVVR